MTVREAKAEANMNRWQAIIAEQRQSGQSIVEFCTGRQITTGQFYKWQRKVLNRLIESQSGSNEEQRVCFAELPPPVEAFPVPLDILVREYRCSGGTDTANPAAGNRCSGTEIPHLIDCYLRVHSLKAGSNPYTSRIDR